jgi:heavy metal sensor kinase
MQVGLWTALLLSLVLACVGIGVGRHLFKEGIHELDSDLHRAADHFFHEIDVRRGEVHWNDSVEVEGLFSRDGRPYFAEIVDQQGHVLHRSRFIELLEVPAVVPNGASVTGYYRKKPLRFASFSSGGLTVTLAVNAHLVYESRDDLIQAFAVASPIVLVLVGLLGWWMAGRALAPVRDAAVAAEAITAEHLDQRLPVPPTDDEIAKLTIVLNRMMDRLETSLQQARRFSADASHELRTPLTIIRGELENALRSPELPANQEQLLLDLLEETERLTSITDGLLLLSRADAGRLALDRKPVDFSALLRETLEDAEILADTSDIRIESNVSSSVVLSGHEPFLRQLLLNLLDNAVKYNRPGGLVQVTLEASGDQCILIVGNTGPGIAPEHAGNIFDRFFRGEAARSSRQRGHGLGLSIVREIARAHGGDIALYASDLDWTEFRVTLSSAEGVIPREVALPSPAKKG